MRTPRPRTPAVALVVTVLALGFAGCGGSGGGGSGGRSERGTAPSRPPSPRASPASGRPVDPALVTGAWPTYHRDNARTGFEPGGRPLRNPRRAWTSAALDGQVYAEPLGVGRRVLVATESNSVYALDARTGRLVWRRHLGTPVDGSTLPCGNIDPSGITATPVADPARGVLYAVAFLAPARHELFALDLRTGRVRFHRPVDAPGADPRVHQLRAALALSRGRVYVADGGLYGDCGDYHGQVVSAPATGARGALVSYRVPTQREGGIWSPSGPAVDTAGNVYVATGNSSSTDRFDFGNAVIRLSPGLRTRGYFAPRGGAKLNASDTDLGSVGPLLLPGGRVFAIGKSGIGYLLRADRLGGVGGALFARSVCGAAFGGLATARGLVYVPCIDGLVALRVQGDRFSMAWRGGGFRAGPPILAAGAVWALDLDGGALHAFDPASGRALGRVAVGPVAQFSTPAALGGLVVVAAQRRVVAVPTH